MSHAQSPLKEVIRPMRTVAFLFVGLLAAATATAQPRSEITPPDVFAHVQTLRAELELVRAEMGRPKSARAILIVSKAAPREVYFQAITLFRKTDQLQFEQLRRRSPLPKPPAGEPRPRHVYRAVDQSLKLLRAVKKDLGCTEQVAAVQRDAGKTPSDVFNAIVEAGQQINALLDQRFSPSNVYAQVTVAIKYASILLDEFPSATRIPKSPAFERRKRPADVFRRLIACFENMKRIGDLSGIKVLALQVNKKMVDQVEPAEVFDLASLLVSELAHLHLQVKKPGKTISSYYPGRKVPSHVFQRAGILQTQLVDLERYVKQNPGWLRKK